MEFARKELLFRDSYIVIEYNPADDWIYANWRGYNNYDTVTAGCERILECLEHYRVTKVLNDNSNLEGIWSGASKWVGQDWLPRMRQAGLLHFAWVYSPSTLGRLSTDKSIKHTTETDIVKTFETIEAAEDWLRLS
ncbi:hypothetical protein CLV24_102191 [Pontibacter ummariensis]|uniref:SpoIIAA-like n=1 Tax=Pontibacter ummariensis TaxID=1610492 RepID=A0A239BWR2_9BACT|nr:hypothetical protein [Pontibacter ummariensis]PRY15569.1 hypothetical protein CLV24_102191 [Pontibacter ummariensis]SNS12457.1 hypothetical protein SAMN06296052_102221 [Pontibacter ummariensis]